MAPAFAASADFAIDKPVGVPCPNLDQRHRCAIHDRLRPRGFRGCAAYDCFGAGQRVAQQTFVGRDWREAPDIAAPMFTVFAVVRQLHELLWYLADAISLGQAGELGEELVQMQLATERLAADSADALLSLDVDAHRAAANALLQRVSEEVRIEVREQPADHRGADMIGADLTGADLRAANLRGALLVAADLRRADLAMADLTGADLRGARLHGADVATSLFLIQAQLDVADGDAETRLPPALVRPGHW